MICPNCGFDNPEDTSYCGKCGTTARRRALRFRHENHRDAHPKAAPGRRFCRPLPDHAKSSAEGGWASSTRPSTTSSSAPSPSSSSPSSGPITPQAKERFVREAQAAAALDHPNICTVHEIDEAEGRMFISMAFVEGESLKTRIDRGLLKIDEALGLAMQVAEGLKRSAQEGSHSPRYQERQHHGHGQWPGEDHGFRPGPDAAEGPC